MFHKKAISYLLIQAMLLGGIIAYSEKHMDINEWNGNQSRNCDYRSSYLYENKNNFKDLIYLWNNLTETGDANTFLWSYYKEVGIVKKINPNTIRILHGVYGEPIEFYEDSKIKKIKQEMKRIESDINRTLEYFKMNQAKIRYSNYGLYNSLTEEVQNKICLYEALVQTHREKKNSMWSKLIKNEAILKSELTKEELLKQLDLTEAYTKAIELKNEKEPILFYNLDFKENYKFLFLNYLFEDELSLLSKAIAFDNYLYQAKELADVQSKVILPYKLGESTHDNLLLAATSLVGKCRYSWGGGHGGASNISGINPVWKRVYQSYNPKDQVSCIGRTVKSRNYPLVNIYSLDDLKTVRGLTYFPYDEHQFMRGRTNFSSSGLSTDSIDGLDCSGYVSWVLNQVDSDRVYDSVARSFATQYSSIKELDPKDIQYNGKLQTGDLISTYTHVSMIVGEAPLGSNVYLHIESSTPCVKFGVSYFDNASYKNIEIAKNIAKEANEIFGGIGHSRLNVVNLNKQFTRKNNIEELLKTDIDFSTMTSDLESESNIDSEKDSYDSFVEEEMGEIGESQENTREEGESEESENQLKAFQRFLQSAKHNDETVEKEEDNLIESEQNISNNELAYEDLFSDKENYGEFSDRDSGTDEEESLSDDTQEKPNETMAKNNIQPVYVKDLRIGRLIFLKSQYKNESAVTKLQRVIDITRNEYLTGRMTYSGKYFKLNN